MGELTVAVVAGAVGAIVGAGAILLLRPAESAPAAFDAKPLADAIDKSMARYAAEIRRVVESRREAVLAAAISRVEGEAAASTAPAARAAATPDPDAATVRRIGAATAVEGRDTPFAASNPAPNYARFRALTDWEDKPELRRAWIFADESTCLAWFGTPDEVQGGGGDETWIYNEPLPDADGDGESDGTRQSCLGFQRGRLIRIDASE